MLWQAFRSAWETTPHPPTDEKHLADPVSLVDWPHSAQVCEVYAGSTKTKGTHALLAL